jgi:hypothetical protein
MQDYAFSPASLTVHVGDTVTWMQHDQAPHDATTTNAPVSFHSPLLSAGQSWSYTFRTAGTYAYYCSVHPDMRATIIALATAPAPQPRPAPAVSAPAKQQPATARATAAPPSTTRASTAPASSSATNPAAGGNVTSAAPPAADQQVTAAAATGPSLDPMLLVAGLVTGIAVLCLLLLSSRRTS